MSSEKMTIVVADDHVALRESLAGLIDQQDDMHVVGQASDCPETLEMTASLQPSVLLLDIGMPGGTGIDVVKQIRDRSLGTTCVFLTMYDQREFLNAALEAGAAGYVTKDTTSQELINALREVARGQTAVHANLENTSKNRVPVPKSPVDPKLSARETQVLRLLARGYTSKEAGAELGISATTVDTYRHRLFEKLKLRHRSELVTYALETGLLE